MGEKGNGKDFSFLGYVVLSLFPAYPVPLMLSSKHAPAHGRLRYGNLPTKRQRACPAASLWRSAFCRLPSAYCFLLFLVPRRSEFRGLRGLGIVFRGEKFLGHRLGVVVVDA